MYTRIDDWMWGHLQGNELLAFAVIHSFTVNSESQKMEGGLTYLSKRLGLTKANTHALMERLVKKGFIEKERIETAPHVVNCKYKSSSAKVMEMRSSFNDERYQNDNGVTETIMGHYRNNNAPVTETITPPVIETITKIDNTIGKEKEKDSVCVKDYAHAHEHTHTHEEQVPPCHADRQPKPQQTDVRDKEREKSEKEKVVVDGITLADATHYDHWGGVEAQERTSRLAHPT